MSVSALSLRIVPELALEILVLLAWYPIPEKDSSP